MKKIKAFSLTVLVACLALCGPAVASPLVVGMPGNGGNCFPFGCATWAPQYQQVYASSDFSGPIAIKQLIFYNSIVPGGAVNAGNYTFDLSMTAAPVDGLDTTNLANNIGTHDIVVFSGSLPAISGGQLVIPFTAPYVYDPAMGNLLMNIYATGVSNTGNTYFDARNRGANGLFSRAMTPGCCGAFSDHGLVTGFTIASVPEPASAVLVASGLVAALRRRRRKPVGRI